MRPFRRFLPWLCCLLVAAGFGAGVLNLVEGFSRADETADGGDYGPDGNLSDDEIAAMAGTVGDETFGPSDHFGRRIREALERDPVARNGVRATHTNASYGDHPRNVFDIWIAESDVPAPLVVFIHGGGFRRGDKSLLYDSRVLVELLDAGVSVAGINYRFSHQAPDGILGSLNDAARFVQFIRFHAETYHVDKSRIACYGGSAGGAASLWLRPIANIVGTVISMPSSEGSSDVIPLTHFRHFSSLISLSSTFVWLTPCLGLRVTISQAGPSGLGSWRSHRRYRPCPAAHRERRSGAARRLLRRAGR